MMEQLPLDLALPPRFGAADYMVSSSNAAAHATIARWPDWPDRVLILTGPEGAGKSHLAAIWAEHARATTVSLDDLARADLATLAARPLVVDDANNSSGFEANLFHLLNLVRDERSFLLLTARVPPDRWGLRTADLLSRLRLAPSVAIGAPDEDLMRAVLVKLFADRQLLVDEQLVGYLVVRLERSLDAARRAVEALDRAALSQHRRVTRPMAAGILDACRLDDD